MARGPIGLMQRQRRRLWLHMTPDMSRSSSEQPVTITEERKSPATRWEVEGQGANDEGNGPQHVPQQALQLTATSPLVTLRHRTIGPGLAEAALLPLARQPRFCRSHSYKPEKEWRRASAGAANSDAGCSSGGAAGVALAIPGAGGIGFLGAPPAAPEARLSL
jgi:hypothetical protein